MRIALLLPLLASIASACSAPDERSDLPDSARAAALAPALEGGCRAMARITRGTLRIAVGRDRAMSFPAPRESSGTWNGCRLVANSGVRPETSTTTPGGSLQAALVAEGWIADPQFSADGPNGTEFGLRHGTTLCAVAISYQGATLGDTPGTPAPDAAQKPRPYRLEIRCTDGAPTSTG
jgi:hypothetical protein